MSDSDSEGDAMGMNRPRPAVMQDLWRLLVGQAHFEGRREAHNNEDLVNHLWSLGTIKSVRVKRALLACPRHLFVPSNLRQEAYIDAPLRVEAHGFNISAPHIHAAALEALELTEGDRFLDVGAGSGLLAAAAAHLVGAKGSVTAVDIRPAALDMSRRAVGLLREDDEDYRTDSCEIQFEQHNIFYRAARHLGAYNKVYIGAACPRDRLREMLDLLGDSGGLLLVPVESQLILYKKLASGRVGKRVLSAVRFSELEVPRDVEVVMACIADERRKARTTHHPPSTYTHDMAQIGTPSDMYTIANITPPDTPHTPQHTAGAAGPSGDAPGSVSQGCLSEGWSLRALLSGSGKGKGGGSVGTSSGGSRGGGMQEACGSVETGGGGGMDSGQLLSADNTPVKAHEPASLDAHIDLSSGAHNDNNSPVGGLMTGSPTNGLVTSCVSQRDRDSVEASSPLKRHKSTGLVRQESYVTDDLATKLGPPDCFLYGTEFITPATAPATAPAMEQQRVPSRPTSPALIPPSLQAARPSSPALLGPDGRWVGGVAPAVPAAGVAWRLPAHRDVLRVRCEHFRAMFLSGMRDADEGVFAAPDGVSAAAARCLLHHVYRDTGVETLPLDKVSEVLHVAIYFGCPNLASHCEQRLERVLLAPEEGSDEVAPQLLALADELVLPQLKRLALSYIVEHYESVSTTESYRALPRHLVDAIAQDACRHTAMVLALLQELSGKQHPSPARSDGNGMSDDEE